MTATTGQKTANAFPASRSSGVLLEQHYHQSRLSERPPFQMPSLPASSEPMLPKAVPPCIVGYAADYGPSWAPTWYDTRLGGSLALPRGVRAIIEPVCKTCGKALALILQAFSPSACHGERVLAVFGCNSMRCAEDEDAWVVYRVMWRGREEGEIVGGDGAEEKEVKAELKVASEMDFEGKIGGGGGSDSDSESESDEDLEAMNNLLNIRNIRLEERAEASLKKTRSRRRATDASASTTLDQDNREPSNEPPQSCAYTKLDLVPIEVDYEITSTSAPADALTTDVERLYSAYTAAQQEGSPSHWVSETEEAVDDRRAALSDFQTRLEQMPGHVVRYQPRGAPVWPTHPPPAPKPKCTCGAERVFEMQLIPTCLYFLRVDERTPAGQEEAGMAWLTVALYVCADDCVPAGCGADGLVVVEERLHVLPEEF